MHSFKKYFSLLALLSVSACGYAMNSSFQSITFLTPGAHNAECDIYVDKIRYKVFPPQTVNIKHSEKDMRVECEAPGNRTVKMMVDSKLYEQALWGGPVGAAWDYASKSLFYYPDVVAIDFSLEELKPNELPKHNSSDIMQPESYDLEEFGGDTPRLNADKYKPKAVLLKREPFGFSADTEAKASMDGESVESEGGDAASEIGGAPSSDGGTIEGVIESLNDSGGHGADVQSVEPQAGDAPQEGLSDAGEEAVAPSEPLQIIPGQ